MGSQHKIAETPKEKFLERTDKLKMHQIRFFFFFRLSHISIENVIEIEKTTVCMIFTTFPGNELIMQQLN